MKVTSDGVFDGGLDLTELRRSNKHEQHGLWMWIAWFLVGLLLLITKRYVKKTWKLSHYLHMFLGCFVLIVTLVMAKQVSHF